LAEAYINQFCYDQMSYYYLWWKDINTKDWRLDDDPVDKIEEIRYKEDRWSMAIENIKPYMDPGTAAQGTFGYDFVLYWADQSQKNLYAVVSMVYPGGPAEKAGLKRGSIIMKNGGKNIKNNSSDINALLTSPSLDLTVALSIDELDTPANVKMNAVDMYLDPVIGEKVFDCGGKKVGYVFFNDFTMECNERLIEVARKFKSEGVTELILDLRYNGGGYVVTEELLASLLAPEDNVKNGDLYQTQVYNGTKYSEALKDYYGPDYVNTYFKTKHEWTYDKKEYSYNTADANIGLTKIYALVSGSTASASEAILVSMMPFLDVEIIGTKTVGKHCAGVMFPAEDYYQGNEDYMAELKKKNPKEYQHMYDEYWKYFKGWKKYVGDWGLYVMISTYADKNGENACRPDGLVPHEEMDDSPIEPYPLGDDREALLRVALQRAGYADFTPLPEEGTGSRAAMKNRLGESLPKQDEGWRIVLKPEIPMPFSSRALGW